MKAAKGAEGHVPGTLFYQYLEWVSQKEHNGRPSSHAIRLHIFRFFFRFQIIYISINEEFGLVRLSRMAALRPFFS